MIQKTPFSSARKWSSVTFEKIGTILFGAPEILLKNQDYRLPARIQTLETEGCRLLLMAWTDTEVKGILPEKRYPVAVIILHDPVRKDAKATLDFFRSQDVELKIISGDNPITVSSIAKQAGFRKYDSYLDASTIKSKEELAAIADKYTIFGRVTPEQKRTLVHSLQNQGHGCCNDRRRRQRCACAQRCRLQYRDGFGKRCCPDQVLSWFCWNPIFLLCRM